MAAIIDPIARANQLSDEVAELAERVRASVVVVRGSRSGSGSGVVWNDQGLIITNHHVAPADRAEIELADRTRLAARVTARAPDLDLAALQVEGRLPSHGLAPATVGDATRLRPGELVLAVGNPLGERNAVTLGMVSAAGAAPWPRGPREVLRVAITLRPGNSGGALADVRGRIVGIPHLVFGAGLALAVPSQVVERFLLGQPEQGAFFGVGARWVELPASVAARYALPSPQGLMLVEIAPGSPAERSGLLIGDILVDARLDGESAAQSGDLLARLRAGGQGEPWRLGLIRAGELRWLEALPAGS